jgi:hypothetical protein
MDEFEKQIKEGLSQNGSLDSEKSDQLKKKALEYFDRSRKKSESTMTACILFCILTIAAAWFKFTASVYVKAQVFYSIVMVVGFIGLVFMGLLSFILNNRIGFLKELRMMKLGMRDDSGKNLVHPLVGSLFQSEIAIWLVGILAVITLVTLFVYPGFNAKRIMMNVNQVTTVETDGGGSIIEHVSYPIFGKTPLTSVVTCAGSEEEAARWKWFDESGRELPRSIGTKEGKTHCTVDLYEPTMPGEWAYYKRVGSLDNIAKKEGETWMVSREIPHCTADYRPKGIKRFAHTIHLPENAIIESITPEPSERYSTGGHSVIRFTRQLKKAGTFSYEIVYRLDGTGETKN